MSNLYSASNKKGIAYIPISNVQKHYNSRPFEVIDSCELVHTNTRGSDRELCVENIIDNKDVQTEHEGNSRATKDIFIDTGGRILESKNAIESCTDKSMKGKCILGRYKN